MLVLQQVDLLELLILLNWNLTDVKCLMTCNSTIRGGRVYLCDSGTMCPYSCGEDYVANFRTLNCTESGVWIPSMSNPTTNKTLCSWTSIVRPDCGKAHSKSGRANIPNGGVPYGGTCSQGDRCEYDCDFMYAKNDAVPFLTCTFTEKWIYFQSRDAYFEENEVDFSTLCSFSPAKLALLVVGVVVPVATIIGFIIYRRRCRDCCKSRCVNEDPGAHEGTDRDIHIDERPRSRITLSRRGMMIHNHPTRSRTRGIRSGVSQTLPDIDHRRNVEIVQPIRIRPPSYTEIDPNLHPPPNTDLQNDTVFVQPVPIGLPSYTRVDTNQPPQPDTELQSGQSMSIGPPSYRRVDTSQPPQHDTELQNTSVLVQPMSIGLPSYSRVEANQPSQLENELQSNSGLVHPVPIGPPSYTSVDPNQMPQPDLEQHTAQTMSIRPPAYSEIDPYQHLPAD